jgi:hypothetical protein
MSTTQIKVEQIKSTGQTLGNLMRADGADNTEWFTPTSLAEEFLAYVVTYEGEIVVNGGEVIWLI